MTRLRIRLSLACYRAGVSLARRGQLGLAFNGHNRIVGAPSRITPSARLMAALATRLLDASRWLICGWR